MSVKQFNGDLFDANLPALAHGCNCRGAMGAGIANVFKDKYPNMYTQYKSVCFRTDFQPGDVFIWVPEKAGDPIIFNLATQFNPGPDAKYSHIAISLNQAIIEAKKWDIKVIGLPRIGCGIGGLDWNIVKTILEELATDIDLHVYSI